MKKDMTRRNRTKIMPGLAVPANVKLKLPNNLRIRRAHTKRKGVSVLSIYSIERRPRLSAAPE